MQLPACCSGNALPQADKQHYGVHSYTVTKGSGKVEVLLAKKAYFVKPPGQKGQVAWSKFGGPRDAWITACTRAGVVP